MLLLLVWQHLNNWKLVIDNPTSVLNIKKKWHNSRIKLYISQCKMAAPLAPFRLCAEQCRFIFSSLFWHLNQAILILCSPKGIMPNFTSVYVILFYKEPICGVSNRCRLIVHVPFETRRWYCYLSADNDYFDGLPQSWRKVSKH